MITMRESKVLLRHAQTTPYSLSSDGALTVIFKIYERYLLHQRKFHSIQDFPYIQTRRLHHLQHWAVKTTANSEK